MKKRLMFKMLGTLCIVAAVLLLSTQNMPLPSYDNDYVGPFDSDGYHRTDNFLFRRNDDQSVSYYGTNSLYGAYLAGRVAHLRQDFSDAAEYYKIVLDKDADNEAVNRAVFIILSSLGKIDQAAAYAQTEIDKGHKPTLAPLIIAIDKFAAGKYAEARESMQALTDPVYETVINPMFNAWTYAGEKNEAEAIACIDKIIDDPAIMATKLFHKAMIYDYLGNHQAAAENYNAIVQNYAPSVTYRILEVITDFYVRSGDKEMAKRISHRYNDSSMLAILLADIDKQIEAGQPGGEAIINTPQKGLAEALFNIGTIFRSANGGAEFAQVYIAASSYLNPDYEVSRLAMANVLEDLGLLKEANRYYAQIRKNSGSYFIAQMKIIENLNTLKNYAEAEKKLKNLLADYPENTQLLSDLGNIASSMNKDSEAIEIYQKALKSMPNHGPASWPIYYSLAVSYDKTQQKDKAEENLQTALKLSNRNPNVLNYLGYSWLSEGKNVDEAVQMIIEAYKQLPYEGHIIDSIGWVFYRLGQYDKAVEYLEQASDMNPGNAVISDHLGDAYWFGGRKNEAVFQWKHALVLKEDNETLDKAAVKEKINNAEVQNNVLQLSDPAVIEALQKVADTPLEENEKTNAKTKKK